MEKVFFATKFVGTHQNTSLRSIGLVSENNKTFYAEPTDYIDTRSIDPIQHNNIIDNLKFNDKSQYFNWNSADANIELKDTSYIISIHLADWFQDILCEYKQKSNQYIDFPIIELWTDQLSYNIILFNQLWGNTINIPKCIYHIPFDICTVFKLNGVDPNIDRKRFTNIRNGNINNALWNAKVIKKCYEKLII